MENASKALIMAAAILMGIMVLSLAVFLVATFGSASAEVEEQNRINQVAQFNSQFTKYDGRTDLTIYDILTVAHLANDNNKQYNLTANDAGINTYYIKVTANTNSNPAKLTTDFTNFENNNENMQAEIISTVNEDGEQVQKLQTYTCKVDISEVTERVYRVQFTRN